MITLAAPGQQGDAHQALVEIRAAPLEHAPGLEDRH
jgi:hypothetical protein